MSLILLILHNNEGTSSSSQQAEQFGLTGTPLFPVSSTEDEPGPSSAARQEVAGERMESRVKEEEEEEKVKKDGAAESQEDE